VKAPKLNVSMTIPADLIELVDRDARRQNDTRSGVVEQWLRRAASAAVEKDIADATAAYYLSLRAHERAEEKALARASSKAARHVSHDDGARRRRRRQARG
jgi:metal-responsive CopG/Arc/MetJ family transcriptional regulator